MRETDGRKLKHDVLEAFRIRAVQRIEDGESPEIVIKALGRSRRTIYKWIALYREQGVDALKATPLSGRPLKLSGAKLRWIFKTVITKNPLRSEEHTSELQSPRSTLFPYTTLFRSRGRCTKGDAPFRETIKAEWCKTAVDIQDSYHKEPFTIEVSICTVDAGDGKGTY